MIHLLVSGHLKNSTEHREEGNEGVGDTNVEENCAASPLAKTSLAHEKTAQG